MHKAGLILVLAILSTNGLAVTAPSVSRQPLPAMLRMGNLGFLATTVTITSVSVSPTITSADGDVTASSAAVTVAFSVTGGKNLTAYLSVSSGSSCSTFPIAATDVTVACQSGTGTTTITCNANQSLTASTPIATSALIHGNGAQTFSVTLNYVFADSWAKKVGSCTLPLTYTVNVQ